jgi:hypothetical protein
MSYWSSLFLDFYFLGYDFLDLWLEWIDVLGELATDIEDDWVVKWKELKAN